jgi:hypothetical protein
MQKESSGDTKNFFLGLLSLFLDKEESESP